MRSTLPSHAHSWLRRRSTRLLAGTTLVLTGCLAAAVVTSPAQAAEASTVLAASTASTASTVLAASTTSTTSAGTSAGRSATAGAASAAAVTRAARAAGIVGVAVNAPATAMQKLDVSSRVAAPSVVQDSFAAVAPQVSQVLRTAAPQTPSETVDSTAAALGATPDERTHLVGAALSYLGVPYVFGGASRSGIDCSGLIMDAYAAIGVALAHGVIAQDAAGQEIPESEAQPGDLVVFDSDEHIGMYLGDGKLIAAPAPGRDVQIQPLWSGVAYHFTRVLAG